MPGPGDLAMIDVSAKSGKLKVSKEDSTSDNSRNSDSKKDSEVDESPEKRLDYSVRMDESHEVFDIPKEL